MTYETNWMDILFYSVYLMLGMDFLVSGILSLKINILLMKHPRLLGIILMRRMLKYQPGKPDKVTPVRRKKKGMSVLSAPSPQIEHSNDLISSLSRFHVKLTSWMYSPRMMASYIILGGLFAILTGVGGLVSLILENFKV